MALSETHKAGGAPQALSVAAEAETANVPEVERKTVTALFAEIKGSMELMEDLDPEEARAIVAPALKLMMDALHRYDGYIVQSTGDGIFALFRSRLRITLCERCLRRHGSRSSTRTVL